MGMDTFAVQDLIEEKGLFENQMDLVMTAMQSNYHNVLKIPKALPQGFAFQPQGGYGTQPQQMRPPAGYPVAP
jgi:hypothetical protein